MAGSRGAIQDTTAGLQPEAVAASLSSGQLVKFARLVIDRQSADLLQALPVAIYLTDADGLITFYNDAAVALWGRRPDGESEWCGSWRMHWPDGRLLPHDECPMAIALKSGKPLSGVEAVAERPDGTRVPFLAYPTPIHDENGVLIGAINMLIDISERKETERAHQLLAAIVESSEDAIVSKDLNSTIRTWNRAAERLFGYSPAEAIGQSITMLIPPDMQNEEGEILGRIRRGERIERYETVRRRKDGSLVDVSLTVSPIRGSRGEIVGASKIAHDITERRRIEEQQRLLLREMNHRVKNLFSLASGVVGLSARYAETPKEMAEAVRQRIGALARAHDLTLPNIAAKQNGGSKGTTLDALLRTIASPYVGFEQNGDERVALNGPEVAIGENAVTGLALLLHEVATNAAKYGALSTPSGHVAVEWRTEGDELRLTWRENGGPKIPGEPESVGFGTTLADATIKQQFGGTIVRDWKSQGLVVQLSIPLERLTR